MMQTYELTTEELDDLARLSKEASATPVILVGSIDMSLWARDRVMQRWQEVAARLGVDPDSIEPHPSGEAKLIRARPLSARQRSEEG